MNGSDFGRQVYAALSHLGDAARFASKDDRPNVIAAITCLLGVPSVQLVAARLAIGDETAAHEAEKLMEAANTGDLQAIDQTLPKRA